MLTDFGEHAAEFAQASGIDGEAVGTPKPALRPMLVNPHGYTIVEYIAKMIEDHWWNVWNPCWMSIRERRCQVTLPDRWLQNESRGVSSKCQPFLQSHNA